MDTRNVPLCAFGEVIKGRGEIIIDEANRATVWTGNNEIDELESYANSNYWKKGIDAAVVGVFNAQGDKKIGYAVFVQSGFLVGSDPDGE